ncbi:hypothetical protein AUP68_07131 [Ilyonectria robusta]
MTIFSPIPAYALGAACFGRGVMGVLSPREEYGHVGLPLESHISASPPATADGGSTSGFVSPLMYFKGIREISYGLTMMALQRQGNEDALTTVAAVLTLVRSAIVECEPGFLLKEEEQTIANLFFLPLLN